MTAVKKSEKKSDWCAIPLILKRLKVTLRHKHSEETTPYTKWLIGDVRCFCNCAGVEVSNPVFLGVGS